MSARPSRRAVRLFTDFHSFEPRRVANFGRGFRMPTEAVLVGDAVNVMYRSDKLNPATGEDEGEIDYIHDHGAGVKVYRTDREAQGPMRRVPQFIVNSTSLVRLGECLGFAYRTEDGEVEAAVRGTLPELYATENGRALLVIQGRRTVKALIWGGRLGVEDRGIVH